MIYSGWSYGSRFGHRYAEILRQFGLKVIAEPDSEQIDLTTAYTHLSLTPFGSPLAHPDDAWLTDIAIPAARQYCETETGRALATQTVEMGLNGFPGTYGWRMPEVWYGSIFCQFHDSIALPMSPVQQIISVTYIDGDNVVQTLDPSSYTLDDWSELNMLNLAPGMTSWPTAMLTRNAVKIRYIAGYGLPDDSPTVWPLPKLIRAAMLVMLGHFYENREATSDLKIDEVGIGVDSLLQRYKLRLSLA